MRVIDELYLKRPFYGAPRMTLWLKQLGYRVNHKRVERLMRVMGLQAIVPGPHTSRPHPEHVVYPYLLRGLTISASNEVWCADITYVPMRRGYLYLVALMDWFSRYVLAWELSNSLETAFCLEALEKGKGQVYTIDMAANVLQNRILCPHFFAFSLFPSNTFLLPCL